MASRGYLDGQGDLVSTGGVEETMETAVCRGLGLRVRAVGM